MAIVKKQAPAKAAPKKGNGGGLSWSSKDAQQTGLFDDAPGEVVAAECVVWDYNGGGDDAPFLHLTIQPLEDEQAEPHEAYIKAGGLDRIVPTDDGQNFQPADGREGVLAFAKNASITTFNDKLEAAGFDMEQLADGVGCLVGLKAHWLRVPGKTKKDTGEPNMVLAIARILDDEPVKKPVGKVAPGKGKPAPQPEPEEDEPADGEEDGGFDAQAEAQTVGNEVLEEAGGPVPKMKFINQVFAKVNKRPKEERKAILEVVNDDGQLESLFSFDGKKVAPQE